MKQPSSFRRAFLMGRRPDRHPWRAFIRGLQAQARGQALDCGWHEGAGRAAWTLDGDIDLAGVAALCREHGVQLALGGLDHASMLSDASVLWLEPQVCAQACQAMPAAPGRWLVQPGCTVAQARAAGLAQFDARHDHLSVAAWLADRRICDWPAGQTWRSGLMLASVLLADGSLAVLGPFGAGSRAALDTLFLQRAVPALFQLNGGPLAQACRQMPEWPARYRLDALSPQAPQQVNLAHLLLGHGGDLAWLRWLVFESAPAPGPDEASARGPFRAPEGLDDPASIAAAELDAGVKALFDPDGLFPHPGQQLP